MEQFCLKNKIKRALALIMAFVMILVLLCACSQKTNDTNGTNATTDTNVGNEPDSPNNTIDYSQGENWAYYGIGEGKAADLFLICPTVDMGRNGNYNMSMDDTATKESFVGALNMEKGIYEDSTTMYAPYYRQMTFPVYSMTDEEMKPYLETTYNDVSAAFEYYFENLNDGRPIILAGFSQGSQLLLMLLEEYLTTLSIAKSLLPPTA